MSVGFFLVVLWFGIAVLTLLAGKFWLFVLAVAVFVAAIPIIRWFAYREADQAAEREQYFDYLRAEGLCRDCEAPLLPNEREKGIFRCGTCRAKRNAQRA